MLRFLGIDYDGASVSLFESSGRGLLSVALSEGGIYGIAQGVPAFSCDIRDLAAGKLHFGPNEVQVKRSGECIVTHQGGLFEISSDLGLLNVRSPIAQCSVGLKNLRLTAAGPIDQVTVNGIAVFPYSVPLELDAAGLQDVLFSGPVVLAPQYWNAALIQRLGDDYIPILIAAMWMALAQLQESEVGAQRARQGAAKRRSDGIRQRFAVVASDCAVLWGVLGALRSLHAFLGGRPPTNG